METVSSALRAHARPDKAIFLAGFFKCLPGGYGRQGDEFLAVTVPNQRLISRQFWKQTSLSELENLLTSQCHEERLTALFMLTERFNRIESEQKDIVDLYLRCMDSIDNWDLVDSSAPRILGAYFWKRDRQPIWDLATSGHLWRERASIISTLYFIKKGDLDMTYALAEKFLHHPHDLMHKAVGWMLRETERVDDERLRRFLEIHGATMPRTMLRYALEHFSKPVRAHYMGLKNSR